MHCPYMGRLQKQTDQPGMKIELLDRDDWGLCSRGHDIIRGEDPQSFAGDRQTLDQRNLQVVQFHVAVEAGAQGLDDSSFENRSGSSSTPLRPPPDRTTTAIKPDPEGPGASLCAFAGFASF